MKKKLQKGMIDLAELLLVGFMAVLIVACIATIETIRQDLEESNPHLCPLVKQEIREAVKDGIQADRDEKLQQLRSLSDEPAKGRFVHF